MTGVEIHHEIWVKVDRGIWIAFECQTFRATLATDWAVCQPVRIYARSLVQNAIMAEIDQHLYNFMEQP